MTACPICREEHGPERGLSWDGMGINSCGLYRTRIMTLYEGQRNAAEILGPIFAAAPELLAALERISRLSIYGDGPDECKPDGDDAMTVLNFHIRAARAAIAKAQGDQ